MTTELKKALKEYFVKKNYSFKNDYYLEDAEMNTLDGIKDHFKEMFKNGNGGELTEKKDGSQKAEAIHSSSMLAFNFFSWIDKDHPLIYEGVRYDKVVFEEQLRVLEQGTKNGTVFRNSNSKANMDVVLAGENKDGQTSLLFIESKFTEHLTNSRSDLTNMVQSYSHPKCYFDQEEGKQWSLLVEKWKEKAQNESKKVYFGGIKQDICHLISLSNLINGYTRDWFNNKGATTDKGSWLKDEYGISVDCDTVIKFRNIIFFPANRYKKDREFAMNYRHLYHKFEEDAMRILQGRFEIGLITYPELWESMKSCISEGKIRDYLQERYIKFQEK